MPLQHHTSVTAVLVLCGLTRSLTASILAHEAMHVWLRLHSSLQQAGTHFLAPVVEEGLCQLIAAQYLEHLTTTTASSTSKAASSSSSCSSDWSSRLLAYYSYQIETDPSPVYGEGFRQAAAGFAALGLHALLDHVVATGQFPIL